MRIPCLKKNSIIVIALSSHDLSPSYSGLAWIAFCLSDLCAFRDRVILYIKGGSVDSFSALRH